MIQWLNEMLISFSRLFARSARHTLTFYNILRNETKFEWMSERKVVFVKLKDVLAYPSPSSYLNQAQCM